MAVERNAVYYFIYTNCAIPIPMYASTNYSIFAFFINMGF